MTSRPDIQPMFLEQVRSKLPPNVSFPDELAEVLNISRDSAYRRIRGETVLSLEEVRTICNHYRLSLDSLLAPTQDSISFNHRAINSTTFTFGDWLMSILKNLEMIHQFPQRELVYCAKDLPMFHYLAIPELAAFKMYFWMRIYHRYEKYTSVPFDQKVVPAEYLATGDRIYNLYSSIPSTEILSDEVANVTTRQIEYSLESGFISQSQGAMLFDCFAQLIDKTRNFAANGSKNGKDNNYFLYKNDILIADNTIFFKMGDKRVTYLTYNTMNILTTSEESFSNIVENFLKNLINKSVLISLTGERERNKFYKRINDHIAASKLRASVMNVSGEPVA
jgi:hypothetical protein